MAHEWPTGTAATTSGEPLQGIRSLVYMMVSEAAPKTEASVVVAVRLEPTIADALRQRAAAEQTTTSIQLRRAVRNHLDLGADQGQ